MQPRLVVRLRVLDYSGYGLLIRSKINPKRHGHFFLSSRGASSLGFEFP